VPGSIKLQPDFVAFKASGNDNILRVDKNKVTSAQWSRAARSYMLKLLMSKNFVDSKNQTAQNWQTMLAKVLK